MPPRDLLLGCLGFGMMAGAPLFDAGPALAQASEKEPNIVFMLADNLGYGELGAYGGGILRGAPTPRIDTLASEGMRLLNFNVEASTSTLVAARSPHLETPMAISKCCNGQRWPAAFAFGLIVHHNDADREYAYDRNAPFGRLDKALDAAALNKWTVVEMKKDWKVIFPFEKS